MDGHVVTIERSEITKPGQMDTSEKGPQIAAFSRSYLRPETSVFYRHGSACTVHRGDACVGISVGEGEPDCSLCHRSAGNFNTRTKGYRRRNILGFLYSLREQPRLRRLNTLCTVLQNLALESLNAVGCVNATTGLLSFSRVASSTPVAHADDDGFYCMSL